MSTTTNVTNLVINKLTKAQYEAIQNPDPTQLYFIIDDNEYAEVSDLPQPSNTAPLKDGTATAGVAATYSRSDHVHPAELPSQSGNTGKFLATNGTVASWENVPKGILSVIADYDTYTNQWVGNIDIPELYDGLTMVLLLPFDPNDNVDETTDGEIEIKLFLNDNSNTGFIPLVSDELYSVYADYFTTGNSIVLTCWDAHNYDSTIATGTYKWFTNEPLPENSSNIGFMLSNLGLISSDSFPLSTPEVIVDENNEAVINSYISVRGDL